MFTLFCKVLFMSGHNQHLDSIEDIKKLMHKSSRFISLSGLSGVAAGACALIAAWVAYGKIEAFRDGSSAYEGGSYMELERSLLWIAGITFLAAFVLAFVFTYLRSRKTGVPVWGYTARRVMINVAVPMLVGGLLIWRMMDMDVYGLVAPACLLFYGMGLINASKYTFPEIRYLGYGQLVLGVLNLWMIGQGLLMWAIGFGVLHIVYGIWMWNKYERKTGEPV